MKNYIRVFILFGSLLFSGCNDQSFLEGLSGPKQYLTAPTGKVIFWTSSDLGCGNISVNVNGQILTITSYYYQGSPSCGAAGCATFQLPVGTYSFTASCSNGTWSGNFSVTASGCLLFRLY